MNELLSPRVRNIFASLFQPGQNPQMPNDMTGQPYQAQDPSQMNGLDPNLLSMLNPSHDAEDRLKSIMDTMPLRENYQPTKLQNIMGRLGGLSASGAAGQANGSLIGYRGMGKEGQNIIESNLNRPFNQAMLDWNAQVKPAGELADAERSTNTNARLTAATLLRDQQAEEKNKTTERGQDIGLQKTQLTLEQKDRFLQYKQYKDAHPNAVIKADKDGNLVGIDPQSKIATLIKDDTGKQIKSDDLPEAEKLFIQHDYRMGEIDERGKTSSNLAETRGWKVGTIPDPSDPTKQIGVRYNEITGEVQPVKFGGRTVTDINRPSTDVSGKDKSGSSKTVIVTDPTTGKSWGIGEDKLAAFMKDNPTWKVTK